MRSTPIIVFFVALLALKTRAQEKSWRSPCTDREIKMSVQLPQNLSTNNPAPLIVYLQGLATARSGTENDTAIIHDFLSQGYVVVTLNYDHHSSARVPLINRDILEIRTEVLHKSFISGIEIDPSHVFIVPSGDRLLRDLVFYRDPDRTLAMDIIYPSHPTRPVGAVIEFSCDNVNRMGDGSLVSCSDTILEAEATEGFAVAMADHPVKAPYKGLDPMPECAWKIKAAVRTLRSQAKALEFNDKIAPIGFSRGSGMALMLVTTKGMPEFEGHGENTNLASEVNGAVVMSGRFSYLDLLPGDHMIPRYNAAWGAQSNHIEFWKREGAIDYLTAPTLPLFLTINCSEDADAQHQMERLRTRLAALGNDEIFMMDREPRGHKVTLVPEILSALDHYLKSRLD